jgi:hypothetical protein
MPQAAFSSRVLDANRNGLAAADVDYWVFNAGPPMIYAAALQMTGGQAIETTDAYSHAWFYSDRGIGTSQDIARQTDVNNADTTPALVNGTMLTTANRRCASDANSIESFSEIENTGGASFSSPAARVDSGLNSESQVSISVQDVQRRDGRVVELTMRTSIAIGGGAETPFLAKLRFPKPHAVGVVRHPMPPLRLRAAGRR